MKLRIEQLAASLKQLAPAYLLSGDEIALKEDALQLIRKRAEAEGFTEREAITVENNFDWDTFASELSNFSLFASKKLIELTIANGKPGDAGSKFIQRYIASPTADNLLIFILPKVESSSTKTKWWQALEKDGVAIQIWPLDITGQKQWLQQQCQPFQLKLDASALEWLQQQAANNLLAGKQEIMKLSLLFPAGSTITFNELQPLLQDNADYSVFDLVDKLNLGQLDAAQKILQKLQASGGEAILILWAITRELRQLYTMLELSQQGQRIPDIVQQYRLPLQRRQPVETALKRLKPAFIEYLLLQTAAIDKIIKGMKIGDTWQALSQLCIQYSKAVA